MELDWQPSVLAQASSARPPALTPPSTACCAATAAAQQRSRANARIAPQAAPEGGSHRRAQDVELAQAQDERRRMRLS